MIHHATESEEKRLKPKEMDQVPRIKRYLKEVGSPVPFFRVAKALDIHEGSTARALTDLTNEKDQYGNPFALKRPDVRFNNPTGGSCGGYQYNPKYGKPSQSWQGNLFKPTATRV